MTETFLENYFRNVAAKVKDIAHSEENKAFYRVRSKMDLEEFDTAIRNMSGNTCMLLELGSGQFGERDTPQHAVRIGIHVLNKSTELFSEIDQARHRALQTLVKILRRMKRDSQGRFEYSDVSAGPLHTEGIYYDGSGRYDDMDAEENWYGKSLYFDFSAAINQVYEPSDYFDQ